MMESSSNAVILDDVRLPVIDSDLSPSPSIDDDHDNSTPPASATASEPIHLAPRHPIYYLQDDLAVFFVDGHLFKVHRWLLTRSSAVFLSMFSECSPDLPDGKTDSTPIPLENVTCKEFEILLHHLYVNHPALESLSLEDCTSLLSISTTFLFQEIRAQVIEELEDRRSVIPPVDIIDLAMKYSIPQWLYSAYCELCERQQALEEVEGLRLGLSSTVKVLRARELIQRDGSWRSKYIVTEVFGPRPQEQTEGICRAKGAKNRKKK